MKLTGKLKGRYVPTFMENLKLPKSEQIQVEIKYPTHEQREILKSEVSYLQGKAGTEIKVKTNHADVIRTCVGSITGLETEIDGEIPDGRALLAAKDPRLEPLIEELVVEIRKQTVLEEDQEKN